MSAITAIVDTAPRMAEILAFSPNLHTVHSPQEEAANPFSAAFSAAVSILEDTNSMVAHSEQLQLDFATGRIDDILSVQMAQGRANDALNFTMQLTNRIIESYREIMRMQI